MGIGFSHGSGSFSYSQYMDFAVKLSGNNSVGDFNYTELTDLKPALVAYSGYTVPVEQLAGVIREMKKRIPRWRDLDDDYLRFLKYMGLRLIEGMEEALAKNEPFTFM